MKFIHSTVSEYSAIRNFNSSTGKKSQPCHRSGRHPPSAEAGIGVQHLIAKALENTSPTTVKELGSVAQHLEAELAITKEQLRQALTANKPAKQNKGAFISTPCY